MSVHLCQSSTARLLEALDLPPHTISLSLEFRSGQLAQMTVRRVLTTEEIEALAEWYETEGLTTLQTGKTTYSMVKRETSTPPASN